MAPIEHGYPFKKLSLRCDKHETWIVICKMAGVVSTLVRITPIYIWHEYIKRQRYMYFKKGTCICLSSYAYMSFKLCVYAFKAHGGEFFNIHIVTKGTLFAIL